VAGLPDLLADEAPGVRCVVTTWSFAYLQVGERAAFVEILARAGRERPLVWLACDGRGVVDLVDPGDEEPSGDVLSAVIFDADGAHPELLASVHSHGRWIDWRAA
jgi:hypothetical protein